MNMKIIRAQKKHFPTIQEYLTPNEQQCVQLMSHVRKESENVYVLVNEIEPFDKLRNRFDRNMGDTPLGDRGDRPLKLSDILGILFVDNTIYHFFKSPDLLEFSDLYDALSPFFQKNRVKCISGESKGTDLLIKILSEHQGEPYQTNHYKLMTAEEVQNPPEKLYNDDQIIRCCENDMEILLPIQKKYIAEEVAPFGRTVSDAEVSIGLRQTLKNQLVLAMISDGEVVAKANTNAIGVNWIQIGGVYTHPMFRRNGYAWHLIAAICRRTANAGKKAALFVKDINVPAMELYKKLGFVNTGFYEICYY